METHRTEASEATDAGSSDTTAGGGASGDCTLDEPLKIGYAADFDLGGIGDVPGSKGA
ncbi:MAG: hypothetical protein ACK5CE_23655 [Actinomycetes bacterium]